ncbi:MAG TPA: carboxypeptidase regulatory-like domain-containing protein [Anaerolineales bacterium]
MKAQYRALTATVALVAVATTGCTFSLIRLPSLSAPATPVPGSLEPTPTALPRAQSVFYASLPEPLAGGETLGLALLDEVTGLSLNAQVFPMQAVDATTYSATLALPFRSVIKYRYVRLGTSQVLEDSALDGPIRYRLYFAAGPSQVRDVISGWSDRPNARETGSIQGRVLNADTGAPIPDVLVTAAGQRAFTDSAGRFDLQGIVTGQSNLVAYAIDGTYEPFQQGATVASGLSTAAEIKLNAAPLVRITFTTSAPNDIQGVPIRIAGNLVELGNTYADLQGGVSTVAERMPVMAIQSDGRYSVTVTLPAGAYVEYKYTLGDGFWNAEHTSTGAFKLRQLVVPNQDSTIQDAVETWNAGTSAPILFEVVAAANTPTTDIISIQLSSYGWTEPMPMWPMGENRWLYKLYGPISTVGDLHYRYCRSGQCGSADDIATAGMNAQGRAVATSLVAQDIQDSVTEWAWLADTEPGTLVGSDITARAGSFVAGVELQAGFRPNWSYYNPQTVQSVQALGANWIVYTPGWTYAGSSPLVFGPAPESDPLWLDSTIMISQARAANLNVALFPSAHFAATQHAFWSGAPRDAAWWQNWFEHYRAFAVHHADLAQAAGAQALVLGGDWLTPALPGGVLSDGSSSGVPSDAALRWQAILAEVRQHFMGKIWWALPLSAGAPQPPLDFLSAADGLYVLWTEPLALEEGASKADLANRAGQLLDTEVAPLAALANKPVMLAIAYPSAQGVKSGCLNAGGQCRGWEDLNQPNNLGSLNLDLDSQAEIYDAILNAVNARSYVNGMISRGFYPPTLLKDTSASVHGKPAADLLWYWFPRLTGVVH